MTKTAETSNDRKAGYGSTSGGLNVGPKKGGVGKGNWGKAGAGEDEVALGEFVCARKGWRASARMPPLLSSGQDIYTRLRESPFGSLKEGMGALRPRFKPLQIIFNCTRGKRT